MSLTAAGPRTAHLSRLGQQLLPILYQHRLIATSQLHRLLTPHTRRPVYLLRQLGHLRTMGLAESADRRAGRMGRCEQLWYITPLGCEIVEAAGEVTTRAYRISPKAAASQLQEHTLAVVDTGIAFTQWASRLDDECGPLDWEPELAHRVREGDSRLGDDAFLVPDAVLRYTRTTGERRQLLTLFLEIDRSTMQVARLGRKLDTYARYASYIPQPPGRRQPVSTQEAWRERYPVFPRLLIILSGASERVLRRRTEDLRALASANPHIAEGNRLRVGVTTAELLSRHGPFPPIVMPVLGDAKRTDVLLTAHSEPGSIR
ncbi:replication-relaxation family protein [Streptomyces sp. BE133]|uniref:replication-relaxation family protein n=1 Tax=Streptomyces sp. BE133 TaxID=3002523 RepID=UPI002E798911|nr:replication-relaxation family protein [Streptomyces sp. BE133]MEE1805180.1 replication-relaxation family protein [Streptomyces sp. BE133]